MLGYILELFWPPQAKILGCLKGIVIIFARHRRKIVECAKEIDIILLAAGENFWGLLLGKLKISGGGLGIPCVSH